MIQCPDCRAMIPDDSAFCDQCGRELKWCPECNRPKRGLECPVCGSDLVPGRKYLGGTPPQASELVGNGWRLVLKPGEFGRSGGMWPAISLGIMLFALVGLQLGEDPAYDLTDQFFLRLHI